MKKYIRVVRNTWEEILTYRLSFTMWRIRTVVLLLSVYFLWYSVLPSNSTLFGYTQSTMLTYILGTSILYAIISATRTYEVAEEIDRGNLTNDLLRPVNYFLYKFAREIGDKAMNVSFSLIELIILFFLLKPPFFIQTDPLSLFFFVISTLLAVLVLFFINLVISFVGFWSPEYWAPRFIFWIIFAFFAGSYFPLDILPKTIYNFFHALPFYYLLYFPLKIYLGKASIIEVYQGIAITLFWLIAFYLLALIIWRKGLKTYTAAGR